MITQLDEVHRMSCLFVAAFSVLGKLSATRLIVHLRELLQLSYGWLEGELGQVVLFN